MNTLSRYLMAILCVVFIMDARSEVISNVQFSHPSPSALAFLQHVDITFDYLCQSEGGVRIFFAPMTGDETTPNYAASPSPIYPVGNGSGTGFITVVTGAVVADRVRIQITNQDQSEMLLEVYVPVYYQFSAHGFTNIVMTPASPTVRQFNTNVNLTFNYTTTEAGGVRIQALPYTHGAPTPYYSVTPSPLFPVGGGSVNSNISITAVEAIVDSIQFRIYTADWNQVLLEFYIPVDYHFANNAISNVRCDITSPAAAPNGQRFNVTFDYTTNESSAVHIWPRPYTDGAPSGGGSSGSPGYPTGNGNGSGYFIINSTNKWVDSIRVWMERSVSPELLAEVYVPVTYHIGSHSITNIKFSPTSPAYFTNNQRDSISWDYTTNETGGVRVIAYPLHGEVLPDHHIWSGSTVLPAGAGSGSSSFTFGADTALIDNIRLRMFNSDLSEALLDLVVPVDFQFISTAPPVGITDDGGDVPLSFGLAQNFPNPFNPKTTIGYTLPKQTHVTLRIYDVLGRELATLVNETQSPGRKSVEFDAGTLSSGVYYYRLEAGNYIETKKLILLK